MSSRTGSSTVAEHIIVSLESIATTNVSTFEQLQALLGRRPVLPVDEVSSKAKNTVVKDKSRKQEPRIVGKKTIKGARSTNPSSFTIHDGPDCEIQALPPKPRQKLATEAFNSSLKCLASAAKARQKSTYNVDEDQSHSRGQLAKPGPLQPFPPNAQQAKAVRGCVQQDGIKDVGTMADCAIVALDCLRQLNSGDQQKDNVDSQRLEKGALVLVDKLITLNLPQYALREASKIYEQYWKRRKNDEQFESRDPSSAAALFMAFGQEPLLEQDLVFVSSYQSHMLRLAILRGFEAVNLSFVSAVRLQCPGGPADVVFRGLKSGQLDRGKAGQQLRTISQALLKLYALSNSNTYHRKERSELNFRLLTEGLLIKCESWLLLDHRPDFNREMWPHVLKGLRRLEVDCGNEISTGFEVALSSVDSITLAVQTMSCVRGTPFDVVNALADMSEKATRYAEGLGLLQECENNSTESSTQHRMLLHWRIIIFQQRAFGVCTKILPRMLDAASASSRDVQIPSLNDLDGVILHGARLRKTLVAIIAAIGQKENETFTSGSNIFTCCLSILADLSKLFWRIACSNEVADDHRRRTQCITSFAKILESLIEIGEKHTLQSADCQKRYASALSECVSLAKEIMEKELDSDLKAALESLLARTSHLYWLRYVNHTADTSHKDKMIALLELSCTSVVGISVKAQKSASYGIKLEKLALAHLATKDVERSCKCFEDVIRFYTRLGALQEAKEAALSGPSHYVWSRQGSVSYSLGQALVSLARLRLTHELNYGTSNFWAYDDETRIPIERCLLFEAQMAAVIEHRFSSRQAETFAQKAGEMINLVLEPDFLVYRLRLVSQILRAIAKNASLSDTLLSSWTMVQKLFEVTPCLAPNNALSSFAESTFLIAKLQYLLHTGSVDIPALETCTKALSSLMMGLPHITALNRAVDDPKFVLNQLQAVNDLAHMLDNTDLALPVLLCIQHVLSIAAPDSYPQRVDILTQLAILYHRSGDASHARKSYEDAAQLLQNIPKSTSAYGKWSLSYIRYLVDVSEAEKAMQIYDTLVTIHESVQISDLSTSRERIQHEYLLSMAAQTASQIAFHQGKLSSYARFARQGIELSTKIWQAAERSHSSVDMNSASMIDVSLQDLSEDLATLTIASKPHVLQPKPRGSLYWPYVDLHCAALHQMISVSIHNGLYKDARCYADQLVKVARTIGSSTREARALSMSAFIYAKASGDVKAAETLRDCQSLSEIVSVEEDQYSQLLQAETLVELEDFGKAEIILDALQSILDRKKADRVTESENTGLQKAPVRGRAKVVKSIKAPPKRATTSTIKSSKVVPVTAGLSLTCSQRFRRQKIQSLRNFISLVENGTSSLTLSVPDLQSLGQNAPDAAVTSAMAMLQQALMQLSSDAVKCVLDEAAVALPVRYRSSRKSGRVSFIQTDTQVDLRIRSKGRVKATTSPTLAVKEQPSSGEALVAGAQKLLNQTYHDFRKSCATEILHLLCKLQSKVALLSSTLNAPFTVSSSELVLHSLSSKDIVQDREYAIIEAERTTRQKAQVLTWPSIAGHEEAHSTSADIVYNLDDLAGIPETWTILTISLADNQKELLLSKITAGRSPFLLRVPLSRSDFDMDNEEFTFADARSELLEIIAEANASAHDARGQGEREARKAWYADREVLDQRLEAWLSNIENVWLGGFRGLMSSDEADEELLTKFGQMLNKVLDKHLPSRQKIGASKFSKIVLHAHVLELFLGLGHPDEQEIDDATMDLLYFVVDILQFGGEHNAYDEIDFDAILVDVFDAIRSCHTRQPLRSSPARHTILIVDKEMASFPWESLSCLKTQSVSRMPSLTSVFQRLKMIRQQCSSAQGYHISAERGAAILNPSSDLSSTQKTFQPIIEAQLPTFDSIISRQPSESDFTSFLVKNELLLYFGHGSGAQYIRGRTIRNLDSCAVTLLMGCSSAQMTESGKFESYGMPGYYIGGMSRCMAVVGTLWDVTDRDIDRFALKTMVEWGLVEEDESVKKALAKSNKKEFHHSQDKPPCPVQERRGVVSLDEAVQKGRSACLLRYLNGAAPVVYGVPVFLQ